MFDAEQLAVEREAEVGSERREKPKGPSAGIARPVDYSWFQPQEYLSEYYSTLGEENKFLLDFYHRVYSEIGRIERLLEFGGGPTIYQIISAAQHSTQIVFADYLVQNREEVRRWLSAHPSKYDWEPYLTYVSELRETPVTPEDLARSIRERVTHVIKCDAYQAEVLGSHRIQGFDVVSSSFCLECISSDRLTFESFVKKIDRLVVKGGTLVLTMLEGAESYRIMDKLFPAISLTEVYMTGLLQSLGYRVTQRGSVEAECEQGYKGILGLAAKKR